MIKQAFDSKPAFIPFIMAGHPNLETTKQAMIALSNAGAQMIELGVPFSDPVADGPINQHAAEMALNQGANLEKIFVLVKELRAEGYHIPILLFSYLNPLLTHGIDNFAIKAKAAGVNGVLIVDLPPEEGLEVYKTLQEKGLEIVLLISPTTNPKRFKFYEDLHPSFLYYISRLAVTGMQHSLSTSLETELHSLRTYFPKTKIAVGFGISDPEQAKTVAKIADGVVIGSLLVQSLEQQGLKSFAQLAKILGEAIRKKSIESKQLIVH